ncbi:SOH1-domain-containing protein [Serendipita vermifera]|nr:SOH1-domain-containing protein [Serendipita vermifera]
MDNSAGSPTAKPELSPEKLANQIRFETELEFVQCLANPHYLASLATQGLLSQPNFIAYLKYLTYWLDVDKGFGRFIVYPHALHHLALLQQPSFREALKDPELRMRLEREQYLHWRTWRVAEQISSLPTSHLRSTTEDIDAPTPTPTRTTRRSGTARSSGARTPAGRTPRGVRTPGSVRTPGIGMGVRTPAARSALSVSYTTKDHLEEVGIEPGGVHATNVDEKHPNLEEATSGETKITGDEMIIDSPVRMSSDQVRAVPIASMEPSSAAPESVENNAVSLEKPAAN